MLTAADVRILDLNSAWHGVPTTVLMENAGRAVAEAALRRLRPSRVVVLCGMGNNGGDGAVAARHLALAGVAVTLVYARPPEDVSTPEARLAQRSLEGSKVKVQAFRDEAALRGLLAGSDLVIDALLGVGVSGELRDPVRAMVKAANASRKPLLSVDVPTGLRGRVQARPQVTLTLHDRKEGMTRPNSGRIVTADIGIPAAAHDVGPGDLAVHFPPNPPTSHKGQNGRVLIVAGGPYLGAPILSALGALRSGADLVHLYSVKPVVNAAVAAAPDLVVHESVHDDRITADDLARIRPLLRRTEVVLIGPGLGDHRETRQAVSELLSMTRKRKAGLVLDADALAVAGQNPQPLRGRPCVLTPHAGEYRELTGTTLPEGDRRQATAVERQARRLASTLLVKGPVDVISDGRSTKINRIHHPWMTVGGTGDVLAGSCASLLAKGMDPFRAACAAAFLCGAAAMKVFEEKSWGSRASDLAAALPLVLRDWVD